jgi:hypothetical protein
MWVDNTYMIGSGHEAAKKACFIAMENLQDNGECEIRLSVEDADEKTLEAIMQALTEATP